MSQSLNQLVSNRILVLVALIALTPVLLLVVELPTRNWLIPFIGSPISLRITSDFLLQLLLPMLTVAGVDWVLRDHPDVRAGEVPFLFPFWTSPALAAFALGSLLTRIEAWGVWITVLFVGVLVIGVLVYNEYVTISPSDLRYGQARLIVTALTYIITFVLFASIYSGRERTALSATQTMLVAFALSLDLLAPHLIGLRTALLHSGIIAWLIGQATWAMNYWNVSNWSAGVLLLAIFYVAVGLTQQFFQGQLRRIVLIEYGLVTLLALIVVRQLAGVR
jgi:hypothetical protein